MYCRCIVKHCSRIEAYRINISFWQSSFRTVNYISTFCPLGFKSPANTSFFSKISDMAEAESLNFDDETSIGMEENMMEKKLKQKKKDK